MSGLIFSLPSEHGQMLASQPWTASEVPSQEDFIGPTWLQEKQHGLSRRHVDLSTAQFTHQHQKQKDRDLHLGLHNTW